MMTVIVISMLVVVCTGTIIGVLLKRRVHKMVDRVDQRRLEIYSRNIPDEIAKVKKLRMAGQTEQQFEGWRAMWDDLVDTRLPNLEEVLIDVETKTSKYKMKAAKLQLEKVEESLAEIEQQLDEMVIEINELVEAEKKNRAEIEEVRTAYKQLSSTLLKKRSAFGEVLPVLETEMTNMKQQLALFEQLTENGDYLQARTQLGALAERLDHVEGKVTAIPSLLIKVKKTLPHELKQLTAGIDQMEESGYHLASFTLHPQVKALQSAVEAAYEGMKVLQVEESSARLTAIDQEIEAIYEILEKEVASKAKLQTMLPSLKEVIEQVKGQLQVLLNETTHVQKSYLLAEAEASLHERLQKELARYQQQLQEIMAMSEAENETFTIIHERAATWREQMQSLSDQVTQGLERLRCLRKDELNAKEAVTRLRAVMLETKRKLHKSNIPGVPVMFIEALDAAEQRVDETQASLTHVPLEMDKVEQWLNEAIALVEENAAAVEALITEAMLAEQVIQYSNRYRSHSEAVRKQLEYAEQAFLAYEYKQAIEVAQEAVAAYDDDVAGKVSALLEVKS